MDEDKLTLTKHIRHHISMFLRNNAWGIAGSLVPGAEMSLKCVADGDDIILDGYVDLPAADGKEAERKLIRHRFNQDDKLQMVKHHCEH